MDIVHQLRSLGERFSPTERRIADACLSDIGFAASATIDQLAERSQTSRSALSRFAKTVGCNDIRELRMQLAQAGAVGHRFVTPQTPAPPHRFERIVSDIETTLRRHLDGFDKTRCQAAVALLAQAPMIYAFGMGGASTMASTELQHRLVRLGYPIAAYHDPMMMRMAAAAAGEQHVVVAMSLSGLTPDVLDAVRLARRYGAQAVVVAPAGSPLAALGDVVLPVHTDESDFIYKPTAARYGMLLAIDIVATELALLNADDSKERLRRVKLALDAYRRGGERLPLGD